VMLSTRAGRTEAGGRRRQPKGAHMQVIPVGPAPGTLGLFGHRALHLRAVLPWVRTACKRQHRAAHPMGDDDHRSGELGHPLARQRSRASYESFDVKERSQREAAASGGWLTEVTHSR